MATNGGFFSYPDRVTTDIYYRKSADRVTKPAVIKSGQVLKARSFVQSDSTGKMIAHTGLAEAALVTFATITTGQTLILGGLTFTAGSGSVTAAELVTIWSALPAGITNTDANVLLLARGIIAATKGTFTAGTFGAWNTTAVDAVSKVRFISTTALTNVTDLADTGTATDPTIVTVGGVTSFPNIAGILLYDVDATAGDVSAEIWTEVSLWNDVIVWAVDPTVDTITKYDGTTVACTAYNTGTFGYDKASTELLRAKFVEATEFEPLGFLKLGELSNG
jgi:hypothetical protein